MGQKPVLRFLVVAQDGRCSAEWRLWTGSKRPSDDTYLAPRHLAGKMKFSFHKDGSFQHGPTAPVREALRPGDRHALDRWTAPPATPTNVRLAIILKFYERELSGEIRKASDALQIPSGPRGGANAVGIFIADHQITPHERRELGLTVYATLARANSGEVLVAGSPVMTDPSQYTADLEAAKSVTNQPAWQWTSDIADLGFGWIHSESATGVRIVTELSSATIARVASPGASYSDDRFAFIGRIDDLPATMRPSIAICGVLVVTRSGNRALYIDGLARCDFEALKQDAVSVSDQLRVHGPDSGWSCGPNGTLFTGLTTSKPHQH